MNKTKKRLILVTNDDGAFSPGIQALTKVARKFGDVVKVAPDKPQSGMGHAITIDSTLRLEKLKSEAGYEAYQCTGTPVDCVKLALDVLLDRTPDLIVSGINHGSNASINVIYSGTMSAAMEGYIEGIPSIGFSLLDHSVEADFSAAVHFAEQIIEKALNEPPADNYCLNVNIPKLSLEFIKGVKVCRQAHAKWQEEFDKRQDPSGKDYYWLTGRFVPFEEEQDSDLFALNNGYVSIVPVDYDMTHYDTMNKLQSWND